MRNEESEGRGAGPERETRRAIMELACRISNSSITWECDRNATVCVLGNPTDDSNEHQNLRIIV